MRRLGFSLILAGALVVLGMYAASDPAAHAVSTGPPEPQGSSGVAGALSLSEPVSGQAAGGVGGPRVAAGLPTVAALTTITRNYVGSTDLVCPAGYRAVLATCGAGNGVVVNGPSPSPPIGTWTSYLTPDASAATGVHCTLGGPGQQSQALVRCAR